VQHRLVCCCVSVWTDDRRLSPAPHAMPLTALHDLPAPAKLNLFLHVVGKRPDGYHLLESVFVLLDWADTLHLHLRRDGQLKRHDLGPALPAEDLCLKAARALQQASGTSLGVDIQIDKQVPWGAGLGGGSSDAATVLLGLNRLWNLRWSRARLLALGATLGADVPFFIGGQTAFVQGIGEQLTPIALQPRWFQLIKPPTAIATAAIFSSSLLTIDKSNAIVMDSLVDTQARVGKLSEEVEAAMDSTPRRFFGRNDLQAAAEAICPEVVQAGRWLEPTFGNSRMTGSGSVVFASAGTGDQAVATFPDGVLPEGWSGRMCRSLQQHPLIGWAD
jgi:4-diphosphocytidyl-2-C-methyl-D-erythritol kinase